MKTIMIILMISASACSAIKDMDNISHNMNSMNQRIDNMSKNIDSMNGSVGGMSSSLGSTSKGIHSQSLMIAMDEMLKPENTKYITLTNANIIPMIPYAKALAEIATADELVGIAFIWMAEINNATTDSFSPSKQLRDSIDLGKWIKLNALQAVSGFIPEQTVHEMVESQITNDGMYKNFVYTILTLRYSFIKDYLLGQPINSDRFEYPIQYTTSLDYLDSLSYLNDKQFNDKLTFKLFGFYDTDNAGLNQIVTVDQSISDYYNTLFNKLNNELDSKYKTDVKYKEVVQSIKSRIQKGMKHD